MSSEQPPIPETSARGDPWRPFLRRFAVTVAVMAAGVLALIVVMDPLNTLPFSPSYHRPALVKNQRYVLPPLARSARFDSAVLGNSTIRLIRPALLDKAFGGQWVQLAMNNGQAYEQLQMGRLFLRHHPHPRAILYGIDRVWCVTGPAVRKYGDGPFPAWMYDENPWNDLPNQFNRRTLELAWRQVEYFMGKRKETISPAGYSSFLPPASAYNLKRARELIYERYAATVMDDKPMPEPMSEAARRGIKLGALDWLQELLRLPPPETLRIVMFVPYHHAFQPKPDTRYEAQWQECKRRITQMAKQSGNAAVVDFMIDSEITRYDENYWDALHYNEQIAEQLVQLLAEAVRTRRDKPDYYRVLDGDDKALASAHRAQTVDHVTRAVPAGPAGRAR